MVVDSYFTIRKNGQSELLVKKSRFLCTLRRVDNEMEAKYFLQEIKKEHWKANHNCSAFLIGEKNEIQRSSDDGEPSGTAGVPMLEVLKKRQLTNVAAVVTRYFGGIKLGTGGLIRAYSQAVSHALNEIGIVKGTLQQEMLVTIDYSTLSKVENFLQKKGYHLKEICYQADVTLICSINISDVELFISDMTNFLSGNLLLEKGVLSYHEQLVANTN